MLQCEKNTLYTGITSDVKKRMREHCGILPSGAKFTRSHKPEKIAGLWSVPDKSSALKTEIKIKSLTKAEKTVLTEKPEILCELLSDIDGISAEKIPDLSEITG